jgi:hypothetical protein
MPFAAVGDQLGEGRVWANLGLLEEIPDMTLLERLAVIRNG